MKATIPLGGGRKEKEAKHSSRVGTRPVQLVPLPPWDPLSAPVELVLKIYREPSRLSRLCLGHSSPRPHLHSRTLRCPGLPRSRAVKSSDILAHSRASLPLHLPSLPRVIQHQPFCRLLKDWPVAVPGVLSGSPGAQPRFRPSWEWRRTGRVPHSKACFFLLASLGGGGGSKLHINVEESVDGKVVTSHKREI